MNSEYQEGVQIQSDGKVVWINDSDGCNIGRFSRNGIDIHHRAEQQIAGGKQCLDCKAGPCTEADWEYFKAGMLKNYNVLIENKHKPRNLAPAKKLELV